MAHNEITIAARPETVWEVLAGAEHYSEWVGGAKESTEAEGRWPEPGSSLEHESGARPATIRDRTVVLEAEPPRRLLLEALLGPFGAVRIELGLTAEGEETLVTMDEGTERGLVAAMGPVAEPAVALRNVFSLRRLKELVEAR